MLILFFFMERRLLQALDIQIIDASTIYCSVYFFVIFKKYVHTFVSSSLYPVLLNAVRLFAKTARSQ